MEAEVGTADAISLETVKSLKRWVKFTHKHEALPCPTQLQPRERPDVSDTFFCVHLRRVEGVTVPRAFLATIGSKSVVKMAVRLSMFHEATHTFFGRTTATQSLELSRDSTSVTFNTPLYFHTNVKDPNAFTVAEIVLEAYDEEEVR